MSIFIDTPVKLVLKIKQLQKLLSFDDAALFLCEQMYDSAMKLYACMNEALTAETEKGAVIAIRRACQKLGSTRYYLSILKETTYLSDSVTIGFYSDLDEIEERIKPVIADIEDSEYDEYY